MKRLWLVLVLLVAGCAPQVNTLVDRAFDPRTVVVGFDPLARFASFGWLPEKLVQRSTSVQTGPNGAYSIEAGLPDSSVGARVIATFHATELSEDCLAVPAESPVKTARDATDKPAPNIKGHRAFWMPTTGPADRVPSVLKWNYRPGAWATLTGESLGGANTEDDHKTLLRIAEGIRTGGTERLRFPAAVALSPQQLRIGFVNVVERSKSSWSMTLALAEEDVCYRPEMGPEKALTVRVEAFVPGIGWGGGQSNTKVDGHLAQRYYDKALAVFDVPGPHIMVMTTDIEFVQPFGAIEDVYRRVKVLGVTPTKPDAPVDTATWTENPIA